MLNKCPQTTLDKTEKKFSVISYTKSEFSTHTMLNKFYSIYKNQNRKEFVSSLIVEAIKIYFAHIFAI